MNKSFYIPFFITSLSMAVLGNTGCHPAYKVTATTAKVEQSLCAEEWLQFPDQPHPMFQELPGPVAEVPAGVVLPAKYIRYSVAKDTLQAFFKQLSTPGKTGGIILPIDKHCEPFTLRTSGAISAGIRQKYPDLASLQGNGVNTKAADIRLDWNGTQMRGQITFNGAIYYIMSVAEKNETVYLVYNREDSGEVKQPFEEKKSPAVNKLYYDR